MKDISLGSLLHTQSGGAMLPFPFHFLRSADLFCVVCQEMRLLRAPQDRPRFIERHSMWWAGIFLSSVLSFLTTNHDETVASFVPSISLVYTTKSDWSQRWVGREVSPDRNHSGLSLVNHISVVLKEAKEGSETIPHIKEPENSSLSALILF